MFNHHSLFLFHKAKSHSEISSQFLNTAC